MVFISRRVFEIRLRAHLDRIDLALAGRIQRKVGPACRSMIDELYRERAGRLTFANRDDLFAECANALVRLDQSIEDR
jgi:hypothetical protein